MTKVKCPKDLEHCEHDITTIRDPRPVECCKCGDNPESCPFALHFGYTLRFCRCPHVLAVREESGL